MKKYIQGILIPAFLTFAIPSHCQTSVLPTNIMQQLLELYLGAMGTMKYSKLLKLL